MTRMLRVALCSAFFCCVTSVSVLAAEPAAPAKEQPKPALSVSPGLSLLPTTPVAAPTAATKGAEVVKIGAVDINRVSSESALGKQSQAKIKEQQAKLQKQVDSRKRQLEKFKSDVERQLPSLTPQQREAKSKEFQKKVEELQKFGMNAEKELMASQEKLTGELLSAIEKAALSVGKSQGLAAVVVKRELLYLGAGVEVTEITDDVVKLVNEGLAKK